MPRLEIRSFSDDDLDDAGRLLAERHRRHREAEPLLPERFEDAAEARAEAEAVWHRDGASGAAALRGSEAVGYLIGAPREDPAWGANVWVEAAGHAVEVAEVVRDLYAAAAERWVEEGRTRHYCLVPASDAALLDAWARLSFGQQAHSGIREVPGDASIPEGVREADEGDVDALVALGPLLNEHHELSPVFSRAGRQWSEDELRKDIEEDLASADVGNLLREVDGRVVANFVVVPVELSSMHAGLARPPGAAYLAWAATLPELRGSGVGVALTEAVFAWARERGYRTMVTDWRATNLLSSRFWPRRGFRTSFVRLYRSIP